MNRAFPLKKHAFLTKVFFFYPKAGRMKEKRFSILLTKILEK